MVDMRALFSSKRSESRLHANTDPMPRMPRNVSPTGSASSSSSEPWDGKCGRCRKLMSKCLCHDDGAHGHIVTGDGAASTDSQEQRPSEKRHLLETLSDMHRTRVHSRLPIKMTQDRSRDRSQQNPTRSNALNGGGVYKHSRSAGEVPSSTSRLHDARSGSSLPPRDRTTSRLLAYQSKKPSNRFNHSRSASTAVPKVSSENCYVDKPIRRRTTADDKDEFPILFEL